MKRLPLADTMGCGRTDGAKDMLQVAGSNTKSHVDTYTWQLILLLTRGKRRRFGGRIRTRLPIPRVRYYLSALSMRTSSSPSLACFALRERRQVGGETRRTTSHYNRTRINPKEWNILRYLNALVIRHSWQSWSGTVVSSVVAQSSSVSVDHSE